MLLALTSAGCAGDEPPYGVDCFVDEPRVLAVVIDPTLDAPSPPDFRCRDTDSWQGGDICDVDELVSLSAAVDGDLNLRAQYMGFYGWWPYIEIDQLATPVRARLCAVFYTDTDETPPCGEPICANAGTVTLSRLPLEGDGLPLDVAFDVGFPGAPSMEGWFEVEAVEAR